ncbi:synaptotagmin-14b isoform X1 [Electrophorus electricus]|uniref:synaptotagmin-14b isoform X1 n=1 Tax=Electrophorus electricus TaxID=8005 RepID=UPI0015D0418A|nr:synaptotagmin-14b isoform X1 [Electrophorus electricus]XP_026861637.2 synaptotagmin-14b isoform X1 [Electrophorus electricus]XP_026861646.2 synaptotagmin-14b isoform X1 [Electrophorus electricus]
MAFFKSFQQNLPSVSSILDTVSNSVSSTVDDLTSAVNDVTCTVSEQLTVQVNTIINKVQSEEQANSQKGTLTGEDAESDANNAHGQKKYKRHIDEDEELRERQKQENERRNDDEWEWCYAPSKGWFRRRRDPNQSQNEKQETVPAVEGEALSSHDQSNSLSTIAKEENKQQNNSEEDSKTEYAKETNENELTEAMKSPSGEMHCDNINESGQTGESNTEQENKNCTNNNGKDGGSLEEELRETTSQLHSASSGENSNSQSAGNENEGSNIHKTTESSLSNEPLANLKQDNPEEGSRGGVGSVEGSSNETNAGEDTVSPNKDVSKKSKAVSGPEVHAVLWLPEMYEPEAQGKYGTLDVAFEYDSSEQYLAVTVTAATDIPFLKSTGNISWQVHLVLLPTKKQRAKTGVQRGPCPMFTETFRFSRLERDALGDYAVRFRLYSVRHMKKEKVLGEKVFCLAKLNLQGKMALPVTLEPGSAAPVQKDILQQCTTGLQGCGSLVSVSRSVGAFSYHSTGESSMPELLLGLLYNSSTGRLSVEVIRGSHFKNSATDQTPNLFCCIKQFTGGQLYIMRDTYVKLVMLDSNGREMSKCKTSVCRGQPSPTYKETFIFQVSLFQLSEVTLQVLVYSRRSSVWRRERLGWVSLGLNSTTEEQEEHWTQMREAEGQQVCQWHTLLDS